MAREKIIKSTITIGQNIFIRNLLLIEVYGFLSNRWGLQLQFGVIGPKWDTQLERDKKLKKNENSASGAFDLALAVPLITSRGLEALKIFLSMNLKIKIIILKLYLFKFCLKIEINREGRG